MAEVFLSYSSADRVKAQAFASFLTQRSCTVFWDRKIPPGKSFDEVIEKELNEARVVIVLWSEAAISSEWVRAEAEDAATRRILIPVMIEKVTIPLRFRIIQAADLSTWDYLTNTGEAAELLRSVGEHIGKQLHAREPTKSPHDGLTKKPREAVGVKPPITEKAHQYPKPLHHKKKRSKVVISLSLFAVGALFFVIAINIGRGDIADFFGYSSLFLFGVGILYTIVAFIYFLLRRKKGSG